MGYLTVKARILILDIKTRKSEDETLTVDIVKKAFMLLAILFILSLFIVYIDVNIPKINKITLKTNKFPSGTNIKLLQISDLHSMDFGDEYKGLLRKITDTKPDAIVITGDLIDHKTEDFEHVYNFLDKLYKLNPNIYYVPGNHELGNRKGLAFIKGVSDRKIAVLRNKNLLFSSKNIEINICGIDDLYNGRPNIEKTFEGINSSLYTILLSHAPNIIFTTTPNSDLILSGHTHGGQIRLPFIGAVVIPNQGFMPKYDKGLFKLSDDRLLYIDSGLGTSVFPIRFLNRSQVTLVTLESSNEN